MQSHSRNTFVIVIDVVIILVIIATVSYIRPGKRQQRAVPSATLSTIYGYPGQTVAISNL
jgi:hypothetical protein